MRACAQAWSFSSGVRCGREDAEGDVERVCEGESWGIEDAGDCWSCWGGEGCERLEEALRTVTGGPNVDAGSNFCIACTSATVLGHVSPLPSSCAGAPPAALLLVVKSVLTSEGEEYVPPPTELLPAAVPVADGLTPTPMPLKSRKLGVTPLPVVGAPPNKSLNSLLVPPVRWLAFTATPLEEAPYGLTPNISRSLAPPPPPTAEVGEV